MLAKKIYWCFTDTAKSIKTSDKEELEKSQAEVERLQSMLNEHINILDETEAEIQDFLNWSANSPSAIPSYALGGLKAIVGV